MVYRTSRCTPRVTVHDARPIIYTVSVDEKPGPGHRAAAPDLPPVPGMVCRRTRLRIRGHGTVSILAGSICTRAHLRQRRERHRSVEFIGLLKQLDEHYPQDAIIRVVLDTIPPTSPRRRWPISAPGPGASSTCTRQAWLWLNLIECAFSKMARPFCATSGSSPKMS